MGFDSAFFDYFCKRKADFIGSLYLNLKNKVLCKYYNKWPEWPKRIGFQKI